MAQINRVTFGFYAPDELREIAVCTIIEPLTRPNEFIYDERSTIRAWDPQKGA